MKYRIEIETTKTGFSAYSPDVPGVGVAGKTREEVERLLREAIVFQQEDDGEPAAERRSKPHAGSK
jgi:predicted RNase H-like HicB family nuclease